MKKLLIALITLSATFSYASKKSYNPEELKTYSFKYKYQNEKFEINKPALSYEEAFDQAASECFKHYKAGQPVTEEKGLDIIDVCANPRS